MFAIHRIYKTLQRFTVTLFAFATVSFSVNAQQTIKGNIHNSKKEPIAFATVTIHTDSLASSTFKDYAISDVSGHFTITTENAIANDWLIIKCIGYKKASYKLTDLSKFISIEMEDDVQTLEEVTVKAAYSGVKFSNDTILFDIDHFRTGTEDNVGEVLKRMPGVEVSETGKVSYAGKDVNKILIDGKDMFSSGNNMIINNLSASSMSGAEILTDYKSNSITNTFSNQETMALNIKTSGNKKFSGNVEANGGYKDKYQGKSTLLYLDNKFSFTSILSTNNIGKPVFSIEDYVNNVVGIENALASKKTSLKLSDKEVQMLFPPENVYKHTNGALSLNASYLPSDKFSFKGNVIYKGSFLEAESFSEDSYYSDNQTNRRKDYGKDKNHYVNATFRETWKPSKTFELNAATSFNLSHFSSFQDVDNNGISDIKTQQNNQLQKFQFTQELSTNYLLKHGILYSYINFDFSNGDGNYDLYTDQKLLPIDYHEVSLDKYSFANSNNLRNALISPQLGYVFPLLKNVKLNTSMSYTFQHREFHYYEKTDNKDTFDWNKYMTNVAFEKNEGLFRFEIGASVSAHNYNSNISGLKTGIKWFTNPYTLLQLVFSQKHRLSLTASHDLEPIEMEYLSRTNRVVGYNRIYDSSDITSPFSRSSKLSMKYYIFDLFSNTMFVFLTGYTNNSNCLQPYITQDGITNISKYDNNGKMENAYAKMNLTKGLGFTPVDAKLTCGYNYTSNNVVINNKRNDLQTYILSTDLGLSSRFKGVFNGEIAGNYHYNENKISNADTKNSTNEWGITLKMHYTYKKLKGFLYGIYTNINNPYYDRAIFDIGFNIEYRMKKLRFKLMGENLLHLNGLEWAGISTTPYYSSTTVYKKIPGYLQFGMSYNF